jgi:hypothetical protein
LLRNGTQKNKFLLMKIFTLLKQILGSVACIFCGILAFTTVKKTSPISKNKTGFMKKTIELIKKFISVMHYREFLPQRENDLLLQPVLICNSTSQKIPVQTRFSKNDVAENAASFAYIPQHHYKPEKKFLMKKGLFISRIIGLSLLLAAIFFGETVSAQLVAGTPTQYTATQNITVPAGTFAMKIEAYGGGAGGSTGYGGGGGGAYASITINNPLTTTNAYNIFAIGAGGGAATAGGSTIFRQGTTTLLTANGGGNGGGTDFHTGGTASTGTGVTSFAGGNGANTGGLTSKGGGAAASASGAGASGSGATGGVGVSPAGSGGTGAGNATTIKGGNYGGGGGSAASSGSGAGAPGLVVITYYTCGTTAPSISTNPVNVCIGQTGIALTNYASGTSLTWYSAATGTAGQSSTAPTVNTASASNTTYYVSQTNGCEGPRASLQVIVNSSNNPSVTLNGSTNITCNGAADGTITIAVSGGTPSYTFYTDGGTNPYAQVSNNGNGTYTYTNLAPNQHYLIRVKDANGCFSASGQ